MKKLLLAALVLTGLSASAQKEAPKPTKEAPKQASADAPFRKHKELPAFDAIYMNGTDTFNTYNIPKGKPVLIVYFSPDCDHCKKMLDAMLPQMDKLKDVDVYMMTFMPPIALRVFNSTYHLENYSNIRFIGSDYKFFFPTFYGVSSVPDLALYDKNKKFVYLWPDVASVDDILREVNKL